MSDYIRQLHSKRMSAWEQAKETLEVAASEKRDLTAEEDAKYVRANQDISDIDEKIGEYQESQRKAAEAGEYFAKLEAKPTEGTRNDNKADELRSWLRGETASRSYDLRPETRTTGDLVKGTATAGGNTVKTSFYDRLVQHLIVNSGVLQANPTVLTTDGGEALQIPKTSTHSSSATIVAEAAALTANEPTFGQVTLNAYKYGFLMTVSHELLNDTSVDLEGYLAMQAGRALGNGFGAHLVNGSGSSQPNGVLIANGGAGGLGKTGETVAQQGTGGVIGGIIADDLIDLFYSVIAPYRNSPSCSWLMQDATVGFVRKLKDGQGRYIWQPGLTAGAPDTILDKPLVTDPNMPAIGTGAKSVLFGDFSTYFVRRVEAIRFERSLDFHFDTDVVTFRTLLRGDGNQVDTTGALKYFIGNTT